MKIYRISQNANNDYDTYSDAVVVVENKEEARRTPPARYYDMNDPNDVRSLEGVWANIKDIKVEYIGEAKEGLAKGVICASFHAG